MLLLAWRSFLLSMGIPSNQPSVLVHIRFCERMQWRIRISSTTLRMLLTRVFVLLYINRAATEASFS